MDTKRRLEDIKEKGWMEPDGSPGFANPLALEQLKANPDPFSAALAVAAGMPIGHVLEIFPLKNLTNAPEYKGQVVNILLNGAAKAMFGVETEKGIIPIPMVSPQLRKEMCSGTLGEGVIIQDNKGVYLASLVIGDQKIQLGRDGKEVYREPIIDIGIS